MHSTRRLSSIILLSLWPFPPFLCLSCLVFLSLILLFQKSSPFFAFLAFSSFSSLLVQFVFLPLFGPLFPPADFPSFSFHMPTISTLIGMQYINSFYIKTLRMYISCDTCSLYTDILLILFQGISSMLSA